MEPILRGGNRLSLRALVTACVACVVLASAPPAAGAEPETEKAAAASSGAVAKVAWVLRLPEEPNVPYLGVLSNNDQSSAGGPAMLYPAPNIAGFFAAVLTHGAILESTRNQQAEQAQQTANHVLAPYQSVLDHFQQRDLMQRGLDKAKVGGAGKLVEYAAKPGAELFVESVPVFSMTQDQTAIVLDNAIVIRAPNVPETPVYKNVLRVVSQPQTRTDLVSFWTANDGENLKSESANLFAQSLELAFLEMNSAKEKNSNPSRTVRYLEGRSQKMERGQIVSESCERIVLKNLRGWLMSVPPQPAVGAADDKCGSKQK